MKIKASRLRPVDGLCALSIAWGKSLRLDLHNPGYDYVYHVVTEGVFCVIFVCHMKPRVLDSFFLALKGHSFLCNANYAINSTLCMYCLVS